jgi:diketogulonate reductase-like aldo/keto reductase
MFIPTKTLHNGFSLPSLGFGTWLMGGDTNRVESSQDGIDARTLSHAIERGFVHIDTAENYGNGHAEEIIGGVIQNFPREKIILATKASQGHHDSHSLSQALDNSLRRLGTDFIDIYYLHRLTPQTPLEETANALNLAHASGKIRHIGVCNFSAASLEKLQSFLAAKIVVNQVHYNLAFREPQHCGLIDHSRAHDYFIAAWRPLRLIKRNSDNPQVTHNIWDSGAFPLLDALSRKYNISNTQLALLWTTYLPHVVTLIKSSNPAHIDEAINSFSVQLTEEDYLDLREKFSPQYALSDTIALDG